jgi:hypothetical protein
MKETIRKILSEDFDWANDVKSDLPDKRILTKKIPVTLSLRDYLNTQFVITNGYTEFSYDYVDVILNDGRVIELTMEGDYDVKYNTYNSLWELVEEQGISNPWEEVIKPIDFNQEVLETYLREFDMVEVIPEVAEILKKVIPLGIKGIYVGSL